ncbi:MAG: hypothetical protein ACE3JK_04280 [Sporolactobacillus sp.]
MLIGFIFIFLDVNLGRINIFPDIVGYAIVFGGALKLFSHFNNKRFVNVKIASLMMIFLTGLDLFIRHSKVLNNVINSSAQLSGRIFSVLYLMVTLSLLAYCIYHLCKAIGEEAHRIGDKQFVGKADHTWHVYCIFQVVFFIFASMGPLIGESRSDSLTFGGVRALIIFIPMGIYLAYLLFQLSSLLIQAERIFSDERQ